MDQILIFVVLPLATIIFSIALQRLFKCPILVAAIVFAIFLILTYTVFGIDFIIFAILFAVLAFITAFLSNLFCRIIRRLQNLEGRNSDCNCDIENNEEEGCGRAGSGYSCNRQNSRNTRNSSRECNCDDSGNENLLTISSRCGNGNSAELLTISTGGTCENNNNNSTNNCNCGCNTDNSNERIVLNAEVVPTNNGRSGAFRGCFRRR